MESLIIQISYLSGAIAFLVLGGLAAFGKIRTQARSLLVAAAVVAGLWCLSVAAQTKWEISTYVWQLLALEFLRSVLWIGFLSSIVGLTGDQRQDMSRYVRLGVGVPVVVAMVAYVALGSGRAAWLSGETYFFLIGLCRMILAIIGLLLIENLYRNASRDRLWAIKYLCFGLGLLFVYDFFFYAESILFQRFASELYGARGFVSAIAAPLIGLSVVRASFWDVDLPVSRRVVFHTAALVTAGVYLILMSFVGYFLGKVGGEVGGVFQISFLVLALVVLLAILTSGSVQARTRLFIARNFYSVRYDYREEWLKFIGTVSKNDGDKKLNDRIVQSIADIVESTAGIMWLKQEGSPYFQPASNWNFEEDLGALAADDALVQALSQCEDIIEFAADGSSLDTDYELAEALGRHRPVWLGIPMHHNEELRGLILLGQSRAPRKIDWEDRGLLSIVAQQAASYIAEEDAQTHLAEAKGLADFNERFAFVAHDLKNVVNQLSIMQQNAKQHADNPAFQQDMIMTVGNSVTRMKSLLSDLNAHRSPDAPTQKAAISPFALNATIEAMLRDWRTKGPVIECDYCNGEISVMGRQGEFTSSLSHLVQNAVDASAGQKAVQIIVSTKSRAAQIEIIDQGPGMDKEFIDEKLFKPFVTTKKDGFGIGVYQIRKQIRDMGGELVVISSPSKGTTMQVRLPLNLE